MGVYFVNVNILVEADSAEQALASVRKSTESICLDSDFDIPCPAIHDIEDAIVNKQYIKGAAFLNLVIYSPSQQKIGGSHCYWSAQFGWARLGNAVRYKSNQIIGRKLPDSIEHDARWVLDPGALELLDR